MSELEEILKLWKNNEIHYSEYDMAIQVRLIVKAEQKKIKECDSIKKNILA